MDAPKPHRRLYTTTIKTGDRAWAGTDAAAQIDLINEDGLEWRMDLSDGNFTTGSSVTFAIDQVNVTNEG